VRIDAITYLSRTHQTAVSRALLPSSLATLQTSSKHPCLAPLAIDRIDRIDLYRVLYADAAAAAAASSSATVRTGVKLPSGRSSSGVSSAPSGQVTRVISTCRFPASYLLR